MTEEQRVAHGLADEADLRGGAFVFVRDDRSRLKHHVFAILGPLDARTFKRDDLERLVEDLDRKILAGDLDWKTARNVWAVVTKMCDDMVRAKRRALKIREDNPASTVRGPEKGDRKAKQFLFPSEFLTFVACETVPLRWRRIVASAIYLYARDGELRAMRWEDGHVDLEHGTAHIHQSYERRSKRIKSTKTGESRRFSIEPNLKPLLDAMNDEKPEGAIFALPSERDMARGLRRWLMHAGVKRAELHEDTPTRKALTFHDLRATGITWMAIRGDDPLKIRQRAGHQSFATTEIYIREAENLRDGFGEVFPPLPTSLLTPPGVSASVSAFGFDRSTGKPNSRSSWRGGRDSNPRPPA